METSGQDEGSVAIVSGNGDAVTWGRASREATPGTTAKSARHRRRAHGRPRPHPRSNPIPETFTAPTTGQDALNLKSHTAKRAGPGSPDPSERWGGGGSPPVAWGARARARPDPLQHRARVHGSDVMHRILEQPRARLGPIRPVGPRPRRCSRRTRGGGPQDPRQHGPPHTGG